MGVQTLLAFYSNGNSITNLAIHLLMRERGGSDLSQSGEAQVPSCQSATGEASPHPTPLSSLFVPLPLTNCGALTYSVPEREKRRQVLATCL